MAEYKLDSAVDSNKIFLVDYCDVIEQRLNPPAYRATFKFNTTLTIKLKKIAFIDPITTFSALKNDEDITFIPMDAVSDKNGVIFKNHTKKIKDTKGYTRFKEGDLIWAKITPCMQNGKSAIVEKTINGYACGSTEFFVIRAKTTNINIKFIHILLRNKNVLRDAQNYFGGSAGHQRVSKDFLENFDIPLLSLEKQNQIVERYEQVYQQKQQKEQKAKALLASIDGYLLDTLGIKLPKKDNSLKARIFTTDFCEVSGERLDCDYYDEYYKSLESLIQTSNFDIKSLKKISKLLASGKTPSSNEYVKKSDFQIIKVGSYQGEYIELSKVAYSSKNNTKIVTSGDIFILSAAHQAEYVGRHIKYLNQTPSLATSYVGELICLRVNNLCNSMFLFSLLNTEFYKRLINREKRGQTSHIYSNDIQNIKIPLPPLTPAEAKTGQISQQEIVEHISAIRAEAKQLQEEATTTLEKVKQEIEAMILGED